MKNHDASNHSFSRFGPLRPLLLVAVMALAAACSDSSTDPVAEPGFLDGADGDPRIGLVVNSTENAFRFIQMGDPEEVRITGLGASSSITATGSTSRGDDIIVPLGNAASVAHIDARTREVERIFIFESGNATGSLFVSDDRVLVLNLLDSEVGAFELDQSGDAIEERAAVPPAPASLVDTPAGIMVVSGNLDASFQPLGDGIVTLIDPQTLQTLGSVETGGTNAGSAAMGPDGLLYVLNTGNFVESATMAIIDPQGPTLVDVVEGVGVGAGSLHIDASGMAFISSFGFGTYAWDTGTRAFVRGPDNPICAPTESGDCRGASSATTDGSGRLYQVHFGSPGQGTPGQIFEFSAGTFALTDSIAAGQGPSSLEIRAF